MANHVSALKRARQTEVKTERNRASKSRLRNSLRSIRETLEGTDKATAEKELRSAASAIDKAVQKGSLHKNTAARYKSRLSARLAKITK